MRLRKLILLAVAGLITLSPGTGAADSFNPMVDTVTYSKSGKIKVYSKTDERTYAVRKKTVLWTIGRYVKYGYVNDDGKYFVAVYGGGNLVPTDAGDELVLLTFYRDGTVIKEVKLSEIIDDKSQLVATTSHSYWGDPVGFGKSHTFKVRRSDGKIISFDLSSY